MTTLHSWKDIANYTGRGARTLQRWEREYGFPVRRAAGKSRASVYAICEEVDEWFTSRPLQEAVSGVRRETPGAKAPILLKQREPDFKKLFEAVPGLYMILSPDLKIVNCSDQYHMATLTTREETQGRYLFDVFPDNPNDITADGVRNLNRSLQRAFKDAVQDTMALQRYDVRRPLSLGGGWEEKYWTPVNSPVFGSGSREVIYFIHRADDVTQLVHLRKRLKEAKRANPALREKIESIESVSPAPSHVIPGFEHLRYEHLRAALQGLEADDRLANITPLIHSLEALLYAVPGDRAARTATYEGIHADFCRQTHTTELLAGQVFPMCPNCGRRVRYRLAHTIANAAEAA